MIVAIIIIVLVVLTGAYLVCEHVFKNKIGESIIEDIPIPQATIPEDATGIEISNIAAQSCMDHAETLFQEGKLTDQQRDYFVNKYKNLIQ